MHQRIQVKPGTHVPQTHPPPRSVHLPVQSQDLIGIHEFKGRFMDPWCVSTPDLTKKVKKYKIVDFGLVLLI